MLFSVTACGGGSTVNGVSKSGNGFALPVDDPAQLASVESDSVELNTAAIPVEVVYPGSQPASAVEPAVMPVAAEPGIELPVPDVDEDLRQPVEQVNYTVDDITDLILVTGQSNALGADTSYDPGADSPHKRVFAFTESGWMRADLHQVWDRGWLPRGNPGTDPSNNFIFHAAKEMAYRRPDRVIGFVLASAPGEGIAYWDAGGDFFAQINQKALTALNEVPHKSGFDGILWHQGESDEGDHSYHLKLDQLISDFRQQSWFAADRPFICGETAQFHVVNRQLMALNSNGDRWSGCVDGAGLQTREDGFHFSAEGLRELGRRYSIKYLSMSEQ